MVTLRYIMARQRYLFFMAYRYGRNCCTDLRMNLCRYIEPPCGDGDLQVTLTGAASIHGKMGWPPHHGAPRASGDGAPADSSHRHQAGVIGLRHEGGTLETKI